MQTQMTETSVQQGDWALNVEQVMVMLERPGLSESGEKVDQVGALGEVADPEDFEAIFGAMSFDGGYDGIESVVAH
ncbi:MAG TPA: hypothetical protein VHD90_05385 [Phototrophicaceae bacterium]|nr:hypothetical protein [Phototrophicaceae bacterium]